MSNSRKLLMIDCQFAGISGDKVVAALIDLGADAQKVTDAMEASKNYVHDCSRMKVKVSHVSRVGLKAKMLRVESRDQTHGRMGGEMIEAVVKCVEDLALPPAARGFSRATVQTLVDAEAKLHGASPESVHLHEAGSVDTVADIVGVAAALDELGLWRNTAIYTSPIAVGGGLFRFSHGVVSSPAPATLEILKSKRFTIVGGPVESELTTPTGAAILVNLASACCAYYPAMKPLSVGYGAGVRDFDDTPNILRLVLGEAVEPQKSDEVFILETNLDDVTGETIGYAMERLLEKGARDVSIIPIFTKKNRPGSIVQVIADRDKVAMISDSLIEETGSLGVRILPCQRHIVNRRLVEIDLELDGVKGKVHGKISKDRFGNIIQIKPEYDDVSSLARRLNLPFRRVWEESQKQVRLKLRNT